MKKLTKIVTGAAAGFGLLALVFAGKGDTEEAGEKAEAQETSASEDQVASVQLPREREGSRVIHEELDGTDLFVG